LFNVLDVAEIKELLSQEIPSSLKSESIPLETALHRVLAEEVTSKEDLPPFNRATMDGFAVMAEDTFGASESVPAILQVTGQVPMGEVPKFPLNRGEAVRVATGSALPENADAVVMLEYTEELKAEEIAVIRPVAPGENLLKKGDDYQKGETVLPTGHFLRGYDLGALAGLGISSLKAVKKPVVAIISTGDEIVDFRDSPRPGQIRDINTTLISSEVITNGGMPVACGIIPDQKDKLQEALYENLHLSDLVIISGGSSVGARDVTVEAIEDCQDGRILFHGIAVRPGKPTIMGKIGEHPVFGLSGNPVSAMIGFYLLVKPSLRKLHGLPPEESFPREVSALLNKNLPSTSGREEYYRVILHNSDNEWIAEPLFGPPGLTNTMVKAQGLVRIPRNAEGAYRGERIKALILE